MNEIDLQKIIQNSKLLWKKSTINNFVLWTGFKDLCGQIWHFEA